MYKLLVPVLLSLSLCAVAADTQVVKSHAGNCAVVVPADWNATGGLGVARSPDKKLLVAVTTPRSMNSLSEVKQMAPSIYTGDKVTKDSGSEFEMAGTGMGGKPNIYRAIPAGSAGVCIAEVNYESGTEDQAKQVIESLKVVK
jgi:hypothetical protein